jgi:hypothetical protein
MTPITQEIEQELTNGMSSNSSEHQTKQLSD